MATKGKDGLTLRQHLEADAYGLIPNPVSLARLEAAPALPPFTSDVWAIFLDMHSRRPWMAEGPLRLPWTEVEAYRGVTGASLPAWKVRAIFAVEDAYFDVRAEHDK